MATASARIDRLRNQDAPGSRDTGLEGHGSETQAVDADQRAPQLDLETFSGPLDLLLALARARRIDLGRIPLPDLLGQLAPALRQAVPLAERSGWLVMAAWLVLLRSRLLLPEDAAVPGRAAARSVAGRQARRLQRQLLGLERVQALAAWLDRQPRLGATCSREGCREKDGCRMAPCRRWMWLHCVGLAWTCSMAGTVRQARRPMHPNAPCCILLELRGRASCA